MAVASSSLCEICRAIDFAQPYHGPEYKRLGADVATHIFYAHCSSLAALENSARSGGCQLCTIILDGILDFARGERDVDDDWEHADMVLEEMLADAELKPQADPTHAGVFRPPTCPTFDAEDVSAPVLLELVLRRPLASDPENRSTDVLVHWTEADADCRRSTLSMCLLPELPDRVKFLLESRDPASDTHTGSRMALDLARMWLQTCDATHTACHQIRAAQTRQLPTRVLHVAVDGSGGQNPFLYTAQPGEIGDYVCLSHCWGQGQHLKTEMNTLAARQASIPVVDMPKTFRDAVEITRHLGHRYLWIDSLCIVQDSDDDWQREAAQMGRYYREATLTLFAEAASGDDDSFYRPRDGTISAPCRTPMFDGLACMVKRIADGTAGSAGGVSGANGQDRPASRCYIQRRLRHWEAYHMPSVSRPLETVRMLRAKKTPLHLRGWTLQEWVLSRRALTFDDEEVAWFCSSAMACECLPEGQAHGEYAEADDSKLTLDHRGEGLWRFQRDTGHLAPEDGSRILHELYNDWQTMVREFTSRRLTFDKDKLPAVAGMAAEFARHMQHADPASIYRAGLWLDDLRRGLAWMVYGSAMDVGRLMANEDEKAASDAAAVKQMPVKSTPRIAAAATAAAPPYRAPSWSWANTKEPVRTTIDSYIEGDNRLHGPGGPPSGSGYRANQGDVENRLRTRGRAMECTLVRCWTMPRRTANPLGEVAAGELTLHGHLRRARVVLRRLGRRAQSWQPQAENRDVILQLGPDDEDEPPQGGEETNNFTGIGVGVTIPDASYWELASLDVDDSTVTFPHTHVWCMPVFYDEYILRCLALVPVVDASGAIRRVFRRVGLASSVAYGPSELMTRGTERLSISSTEQFCAWLEAGPQEEICVV